ncbi:MAG TPA: branched-chain amino acid ABC transporter permease, partial [Azospirillaceae bacterium]|nr:branched-chain amino acid ABC transporter permease [Azospirillaceae bacterium]
TAGALLGGQYFITPMAGGDFMLKTYIAVTIGGWGSPLGAVAGAMLIAFFETGVSLWLSHAWASAALYAATLLILTRRPQGLFGEAAGRRA